MRIGGTMAVAVAVLGLSSMAPAAQLLTKWGGTVPATDGTGRTWNSIDSTQQPNTGTPKALNWADGTAGPTLLVSEPTDVTYGGAIPYVGFNNNGGNTNGPTVLNGTAATFGWVGTGVQAYGNTAAWAGGYAPGALLTIAGLDPAQSYNLYFFAGRMGVSDNRSTAYTVTGLTAQPKAVLNASNNDSNVASVLNVQPDATGTFVIDIRKDSTNDNSSGFYYLNVMEIDTAAVPEPATVSLLGLSSLALLKRRRG